MRVLGLELIARELYSLKNVCVCVYVKERK